MHILSSDLVEEEGEVVGKDGNILDSAEGAKSDLFSVDGGGGCPFCFDGVVFGLAAVGDSNSVDSRTEVGVDG